jgi:demethylmenaquinone methyltransferase/2-methoxy-6-polyprenyl-1,4-benzoquinol methylase
MSKEPYMRDKYWLAGHFYELTTSAAVKRCRVAMLDYLQPGEKCLFAGVGHGEDAIYAAQRGADVTVVDISKTMLGKFQHNLDALQQANDTAIAVTQVQSDILEVADYDQYDMLVANFFLNVFYRDMMVTLLDHLAKLGKPGAKIVIGDFAYPDGNRLSRVSQSLFWYGVATTYWVLAGNAVHPIYNYPEQMKRLGLVVLEKKYFHAYWSVLGQKRT